MPIHYRDEYVTIMLNPMPAQIKRMRRQAAYGSLRATLEDSGDLYVWDADAVTHGDVEIDHGISGLRFEIFESHLWVSLAGGAIELLDTPEKVEEFFAGHGMPGKTLEDKDNLIEICDAVKDRIMTVESVMKVMPNAKVEFDIDPRQEWGITNLGAIESTLQRQAESNRSFM